MSERPPRSAQTFSALSVCSTVDIRDLGGKLSRTRFCWHRVLRGRSDRIPYPRQTHPRAGYSPCLGAGRTVASSRAGCRPSRLAGALRPPLTRPPGAVMLCEWDRRSILTNRNRSLPLEGAQRELAVPNQVLSEPISDCVLRRSAAGHSNGCDENRVSSVRRRVVKVWYSPNWKWQL